MMSNVANLSTPGELLRVLAWIQMVDLEATVPFIEGAQLVQSTKNNYLTAHTWLLKLLEELGEKIERRYVCGRERLCLRRTRVFLNMARPTVLCNVL